MKLAFFGTAEFAVPALQALAPWVGWVVSQPDRPSGRGLKLATSPVKSAAIDLGLHVETPDRARSMEFVEQVRSERFDALVVAAYGQILSESLLTAAHRGGINLHGSILPEYRGAAPIQRCILDGRSETGVTLMQMDWGMDTGDIIAIERVGIEPDETAGELTPRLAATAAKMALEWMPRIIAGSYPRTAQDGSLASYAPKVEKAEAQLRFERPSRSEYNRFRAFTPSPGAYLETVFGVVRVSAARLGVADGQIGTVLAGGEGCVVGFAEGSIDLLEVQPEGKRRMSGRDFANGMRLRVGSSLR